MSEFNAIPDEFISGLFAESDARTKQYEELSSRIGQPAAEAMHGEVEAYIKKEADKAADKARQETIMRLNREYGRTVNAFDGDASKNGFKQIIEEYDKRSEAEAKLYGLTDDHDKSPSNPQSSYSDNEELGTWFEKIDHFLEENREYIKGSSESDGSDKGSDESSDDDSGEPEQPKGNKKQVFLITGPPASGKSTYANKEAGNNDLIFDLDTVMVSLGGKLHDANKALLRKALSIRDSVIQEIANREGTWDNAYFICASPNRAEVEKLLKAMNAKEIRIDASKDECKKRIFNDHTRTNKALQIKLVEKWFSKAGRQKV